MSALLVVVVDVLPEHEDEFNRWYDEEHIPQKRATPGFRSARRFVSHDRPGRSLAARSHSVECHARKRRHPRR